MVASGSIANPVKLAVENISLSFGGVRALTDISLDVRDGEILAIIGPNGAGKTCLVNSISGFYHPQQGKLYFDGQPVSKLSAHRRTQLGIARTFQNIELFTGLSALDNLMAARHPFIKENIVTGALYFRWAHKEEIKHRRVVEDIIDFLEIEPIRKAVVAALPYGMRKRIELGRALACEPKLLLLDEPMAGMNLEEKEDMARFIIDVYEGQGKTYPNSPVLRDGVKSIILIEHDMGVVMDLADRIVVFDFGRKIAEGTPEEIRKDPRVIKAYLGEEV